MWFALLLLLLIALWIGGPVLLVFVIGGFVTFAVWPEIAWAVGALFALACIASLAGWLDRLHEWLIDHADRLAAD